MKVVIPGGSGQVGTVLARALHGDGHDVIVLSRRPEVRPWRVVAWDGATPGNWQSEIDGCDVVINLTGRSVNCRYTAANREEILQSRVLSTRVVGHAIATAARKPRVWLLQILREACGVRLGLPTKKWMLEIGAVFMRTETELILKSRRVVPARLLEHGFKFRYPDWRDAALDLCRQSSGAPRQRARGVGWASNRNGSGRETSTIEGAVR